MKLYNLVTGTLASLTAAQTPAPYTDAKSGITFNTFQHSSGLFFGLALPANATGNTDLIATIGGKGSGWSGVSLGGGMLNELLILAWPNSQAIVSSFRKTANYASPAVATGTFTKSSIANGTYVNSTHWTYTFLCQKCIQTDGTTFQATDTAPSIGFALNSNAPSQKTNPASSVSKHTAQGQVVFDLSKARSEKFNTWRAYAAPNIARSFEG
ncbi:iron reductase domain protein [Cucurbitaria berberidis CBS 394.84]|uniref:Iron reductase domain protein n=1 Tax=Cucurbitaria berberidis CBS 394.84 TaxID=1168544 RepID=A0A9P4L897_9PLEO|nr:iron reductase domain protein [Cucurbitaria berberidis CBS 394.84]KAF1845059.1 iron reductase domain protein [Cucurbitaria berberidis CBS 394.84]